MTGQNPAMGAQEATEPTTWLRHPVDHTEYGFLDGDRVVVRDLDTGKVGEFTATGRRLRGALKWADPHMIRWTIDSAEPSKAIAPSLE